MSTSSYWIFAFTVGLRNFVFSGYMWHLVPLMVWSGATETTAASFVGLMSFSVLIFILCMGWLGDKWSKQRLCSVAMMAGVLGLVVLMVSGSHAWQLAIVVILLGMSETNNTLNGAIMADFFGRERYATLYGWLQVPNQLMSMPAPVLVGWIFDHTGSYFWALVLFSIINAVAAVLYWTLPRPKIPSRVSEPRTIDGR